jgi:hypothetical protein
MSRLMVDSSTPANIPPLKKQLVAGYLTGTPGSNWRGHWDDFPGCTMVSIDQHGFGQVNHSADVIDVEPDCYPITDIPAIKAWLAACTAPRPTVYCDRSDYPAVREFWKGDIWLAAPGDTDIAAYPGVVAIQDGDHDTYDTSTVYDDNWPNVAPKASVTVIGRTVDLFYPPVDNADHYVIYYYTAQGAGQLVSRETRNNVGGLHIPGGNGGKLVISPIVSGKITDPVTLDL